MTTAAYLAVAGVCGVLWAFTPVFFERLFAAGVSETTFAAVTCCIAVGMSCLLLVLIFGFGRDDGRASASHVPWAAFLIAGVASGAIALTAVVTYRSEERVLRASTLADLSTMAELEIDSIGRWLQERRDDAQMLSSDPSFRDALARWLEIGSGDDRRSLSQSLEHLRNISGFDGVALMSETREPLIGDRGAISSAPEFVAAAARVAREGVVFLDVHLRADGSRHMAFLAPLSAPDSDRLAAIAVFDLDPDRRLPPFLLDGSRSVRSGATLLARRDGDRVVEFLGAKTVTWHELSQLDLPAARHIRTGETTMSGVDHRGVSVLAAATTVPISGWVLVAQMDEREAFAGLRRLVLLSSAGAASVLFVTLGLAYFAFQRQQLRAALSEVEARRRAQNAEIRYKATFEQAGVGIVDLSLDGNWLRFNPAFMALTGYDFEQLSSMRGMDLVHPDDRTTVEAVVRKLRREDAATIVGEYRILRADGREGLMSVTASLVREHSMRPYVVCIVDDVTERRRTEDALRMSEERFELAMKGSTDGLWDWQPATDAVSLSPRWKSMLGFEPDEIPDQAEAFRDLIHPDDFEGVRARQRMVCSGTGDTYECEFRMRTKSGDWRDILSRAFLVRDATGRVIRFVGTHSDITERKRDEADLRQAAAVFTNTQEGVVITDPDGSVVSVNPAFSRITGWAREEVLGRPISLLQSGRHTRSFYEDMWRDLSATGAWQGEIWNRRRDGEIYPEWLTISSVYDAAGAVINRLATFTDIGLLKRSEARLSHLAHFDSLTDLPNRLALSGLIEEALSRADASGVGGAVLFLDLDRFKNINDSMGHGVGDELLQKVSRRLAAGLPPSAHLARQGGDEFVCLVEDMGERERVEGLASHLIALLADPFLLTNDREIYISMSIGISRYPEDGHSVVDLIQHADTALYDAKAAGRGGHRFYCQEFTAEASRRLETEVGLRRALERDEFELHYQPLVSARDGRVRGVEALLRWRDPVRGLVGPDRFIPTAEETGLIIAVGEWVMHAACTQMRQWLDMGLGLETMAINLSAREFHHAGILPRLAAVLEKTGLPSRYLELEITEGALMEQGREATLRLEALKETGVRLAVDDFGTGYSSLAYLRRLPIDKLKIDQSFVRDISTDRMSREIVGTIVSLGRTLGLEILAEGVETEEQFGVLRSQGCDTVQGWLFSRALPADEIPLLLGRPRASSRETGVGVKRALG